MTVMLVESGLPRIPAPPVAKVRYGALDAVRGGAMLLGIVLHAAVSYMPGRMPGLFWGVYDEPHHFFGCLFWWIHSFRLPLFFVVAGFFAPMLLELRGPHRFLRQRVRRLLLPFLGGSLVVVPGSFLYAWISRHVTGAPADQSFTAFLLDPAVYGELLGPMHLWFLEDLFILSVLYVGVAWLANRWPPCSFGYAAALFNALPTLLWLWPAILAVPTAAMLCVDLRVFTEHHNSFVPDLGRLAYYGYCFAFGTVLYRQRSRLPAIFGAPLAHLGLSLIATTAMLVLLPRYLSGELGWAGELGLAIVVALQAWLTIFALVGMALRWCNGGNRVVRYLADASYWVYLCHLPLVGYLQLGLYRIDLPAAVKFGLVVAITAALALLSYHNFGRDVRRKSHKRASGPEAFASRHDAKAA